MTPRAWALRAAVLLAGLAAGCIDRGYPLGPSGLVDVRLDTVGSLFAADRVDQNGQGILPRQTPFSTGATLTISDDSQAGNGAFVDVHVEPSEALALASDAKEDARNPTCEARDGKFRCTASPQGIARFVLTSLGSWSGQANLVVSWANQVKTTSITVLPAGLPATAKDFAMVASGLNASDHVLPGYNALTCTTIAMLPSDLGSKWRAGAIRSRQAVVRASAPLDEPGVVANAPLTVDSLHSEAALSLDGACADKDRVSRLRMVFDATGQSPPFFLCFSDIGGSVSFAVTSGALQVQPNPALTVDAEPRVLRVSTLAPVAQLQVPTALFEVSAFDTNLQRIAIPVDLEASNPFVLKLAAASVTLAAEGTDPTQILVTPASIGMSELHVRPRLFKEPDCASLSVTVTTVLP